MATTPNPRGEEARDALQAVLRDQQERAQRRDQAAPAPEEQGPGQLITALALAVLTVWVWVSPPSLVRPPPPPPLAAPVQEAELRLTLFQAVLTVQAYRERTGASPADLLDAFEGPEDIEGLTYERLDDQRFRLFAEREDHVVSYETGEDLGALVGNARRTLETGR